MKKKFSNCLNLKNKANRKVAFAHPFQKPVAKWKGYTPIDFYIPFDPYSAVFPNQCTGRKKCLQFARLPANSANLDASQDNAGKSLP